MSVTFWGVNIHSWLLHAIKRATNVKAGDQYLTYWGFIFLTPEYANTMLPFRGIIIMVVSHAMLYILIHKAPYFEVYIY